MPMNWLKKIVQVQVVNALGAISTRLNSVEGEIKKIMATQADLDTAIASLKATDATLTTAVTAYSTLVGKIQADLAALEAKVAAGTPVDLSAEVSAINTEATNNAAQIANLVAGNTSLTAADAAANPAPAPSAPAATTTGTEPAAPAPTA